MKTIQILARLLHTSIGYLLAMGFQWVRTRSQLLAMLSSIAISLLPEIPRLKVAIIYQERQMGPPSFCPAMGLSIQLSQGPTTSASILLQWAKSNEIQLILIHRQMKQKKPEQLTKNANQPKGEQITNNDKEMQKIPKVPRLLQLHGSTGVQQQKMQSEQLGINKWKIGKYLGGGAFGQVYKALNVKNGVLSAVKKISFMKEEEDVCKDEIAVLAKIHHQNIVRYLQHYHFQDETWIFMEYVPQTLQSFYRDFGPPLYANFMHFARQLITALEYLHKKNIVHKDIKCQNVLLTSKGIVKLTDYGCSKGFDRTISIVNYEKSGNRTQKGTAFWMAPQSVTISCYSRSSDIWSLGCTLLQLATGKRPWSQTNLDDYRVMIHIGTTEDIPYIPQELHQNIKKLIKCCLKREPSQRLDAKQLLKFVQTLQ